VGVIPTFYPPIPTNFKLEWVLRPFVKVEIDPSELVEKTADSRGRITLGSEYANQSVKVLILNE
jgi:hypothetical protein